MNIIPMALMLVVIVSFYWILRHIKTSRDVVFAFAAVLVIGVAVCAVMVGLNGQGEDSPSFQPPPTVINRSR